MVCLKTWNVYPIFREELRVCCRDSESQVLD